MDTPTSEPWIEFVELAFNKNSRRPGWEIIRQLLNRMSENDQDFTSSLAVYNSKIHVYEPFIQYKSRKTETQIDELIGYLFKNAIIRICGIPVALMERLMEFYTPVAVGAIEEMDTETKSELPPDWLIHACCCPDQIVLIIYHDADTLISVRQRGSLNNGID